MNVGNGCALCKASYEHNKCQTCKEGEIGTRENKMQEKLTEQKLNALPKSTPQRERFKLQEKRNVHRKKHDEMLLAYRRHNADDYIMRFHFTHQDNLAMCPQIRRDGKPVAPEDKDVAPIMRPRAGTIFRHNLSGMYHPVTHLAQSKNNIHVIVLGHELDKLSKVMVEVSRVSSTGVRTVRTSLHLEMSLLSAGKRGVARMWTFPPTRYGQSPNAGVDSMAERLQQEQAITEQEAP